MKRKIIGALIVVSVLFSACGRQESNSVIDETVVGEDNIHNEDTADADVSDDNENTPILEAEPDDYTPISDLTEDEIIEIYELAMATEDYEKAGEDTYLWLKSNDSDKVKSKLDNVKAILYGSECLSTLYDADDNPIEITKYTFDKRGNLTSEEYNMDYEDYHQLYTYQYIYDDDTCVSEIMYDINGDIIRDWEAELNEDGEIYQETETYHNMSMEQTISHRFVDGICVQEDTDGIDEEGNEYHEYRKLTYDDNGQLIKDEMYDKTDTGDILIDVSEYEYDDNGSVAKWTYTNNEENYGYSVDYEYDSAGNLIKEHLTEDVHEETYEYTYDKFGNKTSYTYYEHDVIKISSIMDYDFLGNLVMENKTEDGVEQTMIHDFQYSLREGK